ncbi:hypothetical protein EJB05_52717 [Eragrostis curvula]|uniref:Uncharacterized protein n=1 Tax=Eragrostis curvula TaxID=38414 RepID=A0A5J9SS71_9POAL|nr:hypothetical protein EJB05_52717 [Eragrostis curvula]
MAVFHLALARPPLRLHETSLVNLLMSPLQMSRAGLPGCYKRRAIRAIWQTKWKPLGLGVCEESQ